MIAGAVLCAVLGSAFLLLRLGAGVVHRSYDWPFLFRADRTVNDIVIVDLNETTLTQLNQPRWNFDTAFHARLLQRLQREGARLVVFDMVFIDPRPSAGDESFAAAVQASSNVVLGAAFDKSAQPAGGTQILTPRGPLRDAAARLGLVEINSDAD